MTDLNLKGVLLDFGETLTYVDLHLYRRCKEELLSILQKHGYELDLDEMSHTLDNTFLNSTKGEVKNIHHFWIKFLESLDIQPVSSHILEIEEFWSNNIHRMIKFYENVIPTLSYLKKKYQLALVSNCSVGMREIIKALGLDQFFECIILSYELEVRKPDHRMYLEALRRLELNAQDCIFVSDRISDLEGAKEVGLKTILVKQGEFTTQNIKDPNFKPDFEITKIHEIKNLILKFN